MNGPVPLSHVAPHAAMVAGLSPCAKSKRGVVIWRVDGEVIAWGFNAPPRPFRCDGSEACRAACNKVAVHAEETALLNALGWGRSVVGAEMLHVKVVDGQPVAGGGPSCWQCSRAILQAGIAGVWLLYEAGWRRYPAAEFHRLTLEACGLPVGCQEVPHVG